jgi:hypothetical protein
MPHREELLPLFCVVQHIYLICSYLSVLTVSVNHSMRHGVVCDTEPPLCTQLCSCLLIHALNFVVQWHCKYLFQPPFFAVCWKKVARLSSRVWLIDLCPYIGHKIFLRNTIFKCYSIIYLYNILWPFAKLEETTASFSGICPIVNHPYLRKQNVLQYKL